MPHLTNICVLFQITGGSYRFEGFVFIFARKHFQKFQTQHFCVTRKKGVLEKIERESISDKQ